MIARSSKLENSFKHKSAKLLIGNHNYVMMTSAGLTLKG